MTEVLQLIRVSESGSEPVTLDEAKAQLRVTFNDDDTEIEAFIPKARKFIENYCNISIVEQTISLQAQPCGCWQLPYGPVISMVSVQTPERSNGSGPRTYIPSTVDWTIDNGIFDAYSNERQRIVYTAGMTTVPDDLKAAILAQVVYLYEHRGEGTETQSPEALSLAAPYRVLWI